jgi:Dolichyl-phosphate-mannose-protein mannosyltransferase
MPTKPAAWGFHLIHASLVTMLAKALPHSRRTHRWLLAFLVLTAIAYLAYGGGLDNGFHKIDDHRHLANGAGLPFPNGHFRPGQEWTFRLLYPVFGVGAFPYHFLGWLFHLGSTLLLFRLVRELLADEWLALASASVFACLFAPHQAVLWIGANLGVQCTFFYLASLNAWLAWLHKHNWKALLLAFVLFLLSNLFKESGLMALPMMLMIQVHQGSVSDLLTRRSILSWVPFLLVALALILRGLLLDNRTGLSIYAGNPWVIVDRLARSWGHLPLPLNYRSHRTGLQAIAVAVVIAPLVLARMAQNRTPGAMRNTLLALGLILAGHAMVIPVSEEITGERSYYDAAPGFSILLVLGIWHLSLLLPRRCGSAHALLALLLFPWLGLNIYQLRAVENWKYDLVSRHVEVLETSTQDVIKNSRPDEVVLFVDPPLPDPRDFVGLLVACADQDDTQIKTVWLDPHGPELERLLASPKTRNLFRWRDDPPAWRDFDPGGREWLETWEPRWWPGGPEDPRISPLIRIVKLQTGSGG